MKFQTIFPQNRCLISWYIQMHIFITTDPSKKGWILELEIGFQLFSSSILLEPHGIVTFDLYHIKFIFNWFIRLDIILIVCSQKILLFSCNYHLVIDRNNLDNISTILLAILKNTINSATNSPLQCSIYPGEHMHQCMQISFVHVTFLPYMHTVQVGSISVKFNKWLLFQFARVEIPVSQYWIKIFINHNALFL